MASDAPHKMRLEDRQRARNMENPPQWVLNERARFKAEREAKAARQAAYDATCTVEVQCIVHNVHFGDGRAIGWGQTAMVTPEIAKIICDKDMAIRI